MENQEKRTEKPILDIKRYDKGVITELNYSGTTILMTKEEYTRLKNKSIKFNELKQEFDRMKEEHKKQIEKWENVYAFETAKLKNELNEERKKSKNEIERIKNFANQKLTESQKQEQKVKALLEQQGKGRPSKLLKEHKIWIQTVYTDLINRGQKRPIADYYKELVVNHGYTGNYEGVRAYISGSEKNKAWLP